MAGDGNKAAEGGLVLKDVPVAFVGKEEDGSFVVDLFKDDNKAYEHIRVRVPEDAVSRNADDPRSVDIRLPDGDLQGEHEVTEKDADGYETTVMRPGVIAADKLAEAWRESERNREHEAGKRVWLTGLDPALVEDSSGFRVPEPLAKPAGFEKTGYAWFHPGSDRFVQDPGTGLYDVYLGRERDPMEGYEFVRATASGYGRGEMVSGGKRLHDMDDRKAMMKLTGQGRVPETYAATVKANCEAAMAEYGSTYPDGKPGSAYREEDGQTVLLGVPESCIGRIGAMSDPMNWGPVRNIIEIPWMKTGGTVSFAVPDGRSRGPRRSGDGFDVPVADEYVAVTFTKADGAAVPAELHASQLAGGYQAWVDAGRPSYENNRAPAVEPVGTTELDVAKKLLDRQKPVWDSVWQHAHEMDLAEQEAKKAVEVPSGTAAGLLGAMRAQAAKAAENAGTGVADEGVETGTKPEPAAKAAPGKYGKMASDTLGGVSEGRSGPEAEDEIGK